MKGIRGQASDPIKYIGELIDRVTTSVKQYNVHPGSAVVARVGSFGTEMEIEHLAVQQTITGPKLVLQLKER